MFVEEDPNDERLSKMTASADEEGMAIVEKVAEHDYLQTVETAKMIEKLVSDEKRLTEDMKGYWDYPVTNEVTIGLIESDNLRLSADAKVLEIEVSLIEKEWRQDE